MSNRIVFLLAALLLSIGTYAAAETFIVPVISNDDFAMAIVAQPEPVIELPDSVCQAPLVETTVALVGDIMLSRDVNATMVREGDWNYPFSAMQAWLSSADITFGNLETAVAKGSISRTGISFRSSPETAVALAKSGFDVVSLANNHTPNFGQTGLTETFANLRAAGVLYAGAGVDDREAWSPAYISRNGLVFAFIAANDSDVVPTSYGAAVDRAGTALMSLDRLKESLAEARAVADVVIVSMHSGREYVTTPNSRQTSFAHAAIDGGADLVVGHHAHVVQEMEMYNGRPIIYGLGNFVFDQTWSQATQEGLAMRVVFEGKKLARFEFVPVNIGREYQPRPTESVQAARVLSRLGLEVNSLSSFVETEKGAWRKTEAWGLSFGTETAPGACTRDADSAAPVLPSDSVADGYLTIADRRLVAAWRNSETGPIQYLAEDDGEDWKELVTLRGQICDWRLLSERDGAWRVAALLAPPPAGKDACNGELTPSVLKAGPGSLDVTDLAPAAKFVGLSIAETPSGRMIMLRSINP